MKNIRMQSQNPKNATAKIDTCNVAGYNLCMIKSFAHKGLKEFYYTGSKKGIKPEHANRLGRMRILSIIWIITD